MKKKEKISENASFAKKDKHSRREVLEEYLLALVIQSEEPKKLFDIAFKILRDYKFEIPSFGKIADTLLSFFKTYKNLRDDKTRFNDKKFSKSLQPELAKAFNLCFLYPLPKFINSEKYIEELKKKAGELRTLFIKDKIKVSSESLKNKERYEKESSIRDLQKELSGLIRLLSEE